MSAGGSLLALVFALCGAGAAAGLTVPDRRAPLLLAWVGSLAALALACASGSVLVSGEPLEGRLWTIAPLGSLSIAIDRLSALFLLAAALVMLASSIFSAGYLERYLGHYSLRTFTAWYLLLFASIVLILIAADALLFLLAWEAMSILSYLLVNFEHRRGETSRAAYLMLAMGEAGFVAVAVAFVVLAAQGGSLDFAALRRSGEELGPLSRWIVFLLTFFGFGVKAGLVPVNTWLPRAHPVAPANVSAVLSAAILNLGVYGIVRFNFDVLRVGSAEAGIVVLVIGSVSALVGILYATTSNDLKTLLAHSSIENVGIVTACLGAALVFATAGRHALAAMALVTALYHMVNHSTYKALLFLGAGSIDARAGTRDLNRLGGLIHGMPRTAAAFLVGSLAISALPPLNGFVSEWLTLQTMLRSAELASIEAKIIFALCGAALALTAALAVTCFVKAFAMGFLGMPRSEGAAKASEAPRSSFAALVLLAVLCLALGVLPTYVIGVLDGVVAPMSGARAAEALVPPFFAGAAGHEGL
ncbi:MAG TPA: proton-conducting transporter membrane subunit, partial [Casimicrobiaceae bacterium]|nr:proton-conducting transporter membrane subunit [Casimicrobiaceae bacterium]